MRVGVTVACDKREYTISVEVADGKTPKDTLKRMLADGLTKPCLLGDAIEYVCGGEWPRGQ